jgi:hypothetical protein
LIRRMVAQKVAYNVTKIHSYFVMVNTNRQTTVNKSLRAYLIN